MVRILLGPDCALADSAPPPSSVAAKQSNIDVHRITIVIVYRIAVVAPLNGRAAATGEPLSGCPSHVDNMHYVKACYSGGVRMSVSRSTFQDSRRDRKFMPSRS